MADAQGRQTNSLDYGYFNGTPGSVATGSDAVGQSTEASHYDLNPAYRPSVDTQGAQAGLGVQDPGAPEPAGASDLDNPIANENQRNQGPPA